MGAKNSKSGNTKTESTPLIYPDFTFSSGFVFAILISVIFLTLSWYLGTIDKQASVFYKKMMCDFVE